MEYVYVDVSMREEICQRARSAVNNKSFPVPTGSPPHTAVLTTYLMRRLAEKMAETTEPPAKRRNTQDMTAVVGWMRGMEMLASGIGLIPETRSSGVDGPTRSSGSKSRASIGTAVDHPRPPPIALPTGSFHHQHGPTDHHPESSSLAAPYREDEPAQHPIERTIHPKIPVWVFHQALLALSEELALPKQQIFAILCLLPRDHRGFVLVTYAVRSVATLLREFFLSPRRYTGLLSSGVGRATTRLTAGAKMRTTNMGGAGRVTKTSSSLSRGAMGGMDRGATGGGGGMLLGGSSRTGGLVHKRGYVVQGETCSIYEPT